VCHISRNGEGWYGGYDPDEYLDDFGARRCDATTTLDPSSSPNPAGPGRPPLARDRAYRFTLICLTAKIAGAAASRVRPVAIT
jgi:hypothetical protein